MEVILAAVRPKQNVNGLDYRSKLYDILLLDHKNVDTNGKPTKYLPAFPLTVEEEPRDEILRHLYNLTGAEHGGIKGERALVIPWNRKEGHRESLTQFSLFCIPISPRDKLNGTFVEKSPNSPGFYSLDNLVHSINENLMNFPPPTRTFVEHLEAWLKEKHSKPGALEILFRSRADFRIKVWVNNPVFLPFSMSSTMRTDVPEEIRVTANELFARMMEIEKCTKVVINPLFGSSLALKTSTRPTLQTWPWPTPDYIDSSPASRKSSLDSINIDERDLYPLHKYSAKGDYMKVQECLTRGFSILRRDSYGWNALHYAARYGSKDIVQLLLQSGCSPNVVTEDDRTPLHLAASKGYPAVVNVLLSHPEIDINVVDRMGYKPLDMCKYKLGWEHIQIAKKLEMAMQQPMQIQVHLMDGTSRSLSLVDGANTTVQQLNQQMLRIFNMPETPYEDIFTIWLCGPSLELQLKQEHKPIEHMNDWTQRLVSMLTDGDPNTEKPSLKWRRNAKISLIVEQEAMHIDAIRLLFHEARINYIDSLYPCKEQDVMELAFILLYLDHGGNDQHLQEVKRTLNNNFGSLVPQPMQKSIKLNKIFEKYRERCSKITERNEARLKFSLHKSFLDTCRKLTVYGSAFFTGSLQIDNTKTPKCFIGVNDVGLHIINAVTRQMLHTYKYSEISWGVAPDDLVLLEVRVVRNDLKSSQSNMPTVLKLKSKQAGMIHHLMRKLSHINSNYGISGYQRAINTK